MKPTLAFVENLARQAGDIIRAGYNTDFKIAYKGDIDPVTEIDQQSEKLILSAIHNNFPDHQIAAEESGNLAGNADHQWYIDPLDGTVNFSHNLPIFCVSLAYAYQGNLMLGVVYDPMRDECFSAERGIGAWLNGKVINVSKTQLLAKSLLVTGFPYDMWNSQENNLQYFARFIHTCQAVRRLGSAALDFCYVAAGRMDGFWEIKLSSWDIAAGALIAQEAGAVVTDLCGGDGYLSPPYSVVAANPALHPQMLAVINE